jgi:hypothetical protein
MTSSDELPVRHCRAGVCCTPIRKPGSFGHFFHEFGLLVFFLPTAVPSDILGDVSRVPT